MAVTQATDLADFSSGIGTAGAILEVDNANNRIGIGTTNPSVLLDVDGDVRITGIITASSANFNGNVSIAGTLTYEDVTNIDSVGLITARSGIDIGTGTSISSPASNELALGTNNVERLRISSGGDMRLGTGTPTSFGPTFQIAGTDPALLLQDTATAVDYFGVNVTSGIAQLWYDDAAALTINTASGISGSGLAERLRITSDGSVGTGGLIPSSGNLVVNSTIRSQNASSNTSYIGFTQYTGNTTVGSMFSYMGGDGRNSGYLNFSTNNTERLRINSAGKVLVGFTTARGNFYNTSTINPKLQIEGTDYSSSALSITSNGASNSRNPYSILLLSRSRGTDFASNTIVADDDVLGAVDFQGNDGTQFVSAAAIEAIVDGTPGADDMPGALTFLTTVDGAATPTERLRITSAGNIGIGTDNPGALLQIHKDAAGNLPLLQTKSHATATGSFTNNYSVEFRHATSTVTHGMLISNKETADARKTLDVADGNGVFATFTNGKVGIGTEIPSYSLSIAGTGAVRNEIVCTDNNGAGAGVYFRTMNGGSMVSNATIRTDNAGNLQIFSGTSSDAERLRITSAGNIGINRLDPDQKLNVNGCAEFNAYDGVNGTSGYYTSKGLIIGNLYDAGKSYTGSDDRTACIWQERGLDLDFATNDTLRMKINSAGLITTPAGPAFMAYRPQSTWNVSANSVFPFNTVEYNRGGHFSTTTHRFTAPTTAIYQFNFSIIYYAQNFTNAWVSLRKNQNRINGGDLHFSVEFSNASRWHNVSYSMCISLTVGDYVEMWNGGQALDYHGNNWSNFSGFLVG